LLNACYRFQLFDQLAQFGGVDFAAIEKGDENLGAIALWAVAKPIAYILR
jgi:hypothetical protein